MILFPLWQLYVNGELIGGLDIMKEMDASGDLVESFKLASCKKSVPEPIEQRWELTNPIFLLYNSNKKHF